MNSTNQTVRPANRHAIDPVPLDVHLATSSRRLEADEPVRPAESGFIRTPAAQALEGGACYNCWKRLESVTKILRAEKMRKLAPVMIVAAPASEKRLDALQYHVSRLQEVARNSWRTMDATVIGPHEGTVLMSRLSHVILRAVSAAQKTRYPSMTVGIDGADQYSPRAFAMAWKIKILANLGVHIICTVDPRYTDARQLEFALRVVGLKVDLRRLHEKSYRLLSDRSSPLSTAHEEPVCAKTTAGLGDTGLLRVASKSLKTRTRRPSDIRRSKTT